MSKSIRHWGVWSVLGVVVLMGLWLFGAPKPKVPNIQLEATFRAQTNPALEGYDYYVDKIFNDDYDLGPYVTTDDGSVSVWFTPSNAGGTTDGGDLLFKLEHHAARRVNMVFPLASSAECGSLPDTYGLYNWLPDDPVDYFRFKTYNVGWYAAPHLDFLKMAPGVENTQQVRLETVVCTVERHNFYLKYNNLESVSTIVQVTAYDDDLPADGILDRWEIQPVAGTNGLLDIRQLVGNGARKHYCEYGSHFMPFLLTLKRIK